MPMTTSTPPMMRRTVMSTPQLTRVQEAAHAVLDEPHPWCCMKVARKEKLRWRSTLLLACVGGSTERLPEGIGRFHRE
jgi:hypothetical protein